MPNVPEEPTNNSIPPGRVDHRPEFIGWLSKYRPCEKGKDAPEVHELAVLVFSLVDEVGADFFWQAISVPEDFARGQLGPIKHTGAQGVFKMLERIQELMSARRLTNVPTETPTSSPSVWRRFRNSQAWASG